MKSRLQYVYSITVFFGALVTAYLMMDRESNATMPVRALQTPGFRNEAVVMDPAVNRLFEMEEAWNSRSRENQENRRPSQLPQD